MGIYRKMDIPSYKKVSGANYWIRLYLLKGEIFQRFRAMDALTSQQHAVERANLGRIFPPQYVSFCFIVYLRTVIYSGTQRTIEK